MGMDKFVYGIRSEKVFVARSRPGNKPSWLFQSILRKEKEETILVGIVGRKLFSFFRQAWAESRPGEREGNG